MIAHKSFIPCKGPWLLSIKTNLLFGSYFCILTETHWRMKWHPTPVLLPGKSHGRKSLVGCSPWGCKESDATEQFHFTHFPHFILYHWRRKWQPNLVFLPGESHGQGSLAGRGPWGYRELDTTEVTKHAWQRIWGKLYFSSIILVSKDF